MKLQHAFSVNRAIRILLAVLFFFVFAEALYVPLFAVFVTDAIEGGTLATVGIAIGIFGVIKSVIQLPIARWLDAHKGERDDFWVLVAGSIFTTLYPFALLFVNQPWQLYATSAFLGAGTALFMAAYYALFAHHVDRGAEGFEWSLFSVGGLTISDAMGAAAGGILADLWGFHTLFILSGIIIGTTSLLLMFLYSYVRKVPPQERMPVAALHAVFRKRR